MRTDAADMLKRRLKHPAVPLKPLSEIAGHADSRTTKLYDRRGQKVLLEDMEDSVLSFRPSAIPMQPANLENLVVDVGQIRDCSRLPLTIRR